jgi:hypothetical protein
LDGILMKSLKEKRMLQIENLVLRLPGTGEEEGRRLSQEVAKRLSELIPDGHHKTIPSINIRLGWVAGEGHDQLVKRIVDKILFEIGTKEIDLIGR